MSIADKLSRLSTAKDNIVAALTAKGVSAAGHGFEDFSADIQGISTGEMGTFAITTAVGDQTTEISFSVLGEPKVFGFEAWSGSTFISTRYIISGHVNLTQNPPRIHAAIGYTQSSSGKLSYTEYLTWTYSEGTLNLSTSSVSQNTPVFGRNITYRLYYIY